MTLAGIGPIIYPPLINYLLHIYDVSGCMLIIGAISLHMLVAAVLLQPLKWHLVRDRTLYIPKSDSIYMPTVLPNVATYISIGKFSDSSCKFETSILKLYSLISQISFQFYRTVHFVCRLLRTNLGQNANHPFSKSAMTSIHKVYTVSIK